MKAQGVQVRRKGKNHCTKLRVGTMDRVKGASDTAHNLKVSELFLEY